MGITESVFTLITNIVSQSYIGQNQNILVKVFCFFVFELIAHINSNRTRGSFREFIELMERPKPE